MTIPTPHAAAAPSAERDGDRSRDRSRDRGRLRLHTALLLLTFGSGAIDAFAFLSLGGIFTGMMTGNLILSGMFTRAAYVHTLLGVGVAIVFFAGGAYLGFRIVSRVAAAARNRSVAVRVLLISIAAQVAALAIWTACTVGSRSVAPGVQFVLIAILAVALSTQTVAAKTCSDTAGVTTTYSTGTVTAIMQQLVEARGAGNSIRVLTVVVLPLGAAASTALLLVAPWAALVPSVGAAGVAAVLLRKAGDRGR